jgi:hypothetical protein
MPLAETNITEIPPSEIKESKKIEKTTPVRSTKHKTIPLTTIKDKTLVKTDEGYVYDNVTFDHDVPTYAFTVISESRIPEAATEDFFQVKGLIASVDPAQAKKTRLSNGIVTWPGGSLTAPSIGTEVYLRIIEDRLIGDPELKEKLLEKTRIFLIQKVRSILKALAD